MSQLVQDTIALVSKATTAEEATKAISNKYPKLSAKESANVVKDLQDFADRNMSLEELDHWLKQRGL